MTELGKNTGRSYEVLTQGIFQAIVNQGEVKTIVVERNRTIQGKSTSHQIDVYWKFERGGIPYETVVQAKDWATPVEQGQLILFKGVLDDLLGQPRGIFVTRSGYQKGARDFAAAHGILLYELSEPAKKPNTRITPLGWIVFTVECRTFKVPSPSPDVGTVDELVMGIKSTVFQPVYSGFVFHVTKQSFREYLGEGNLDKTQVPLGNLIPSEFILYDGAHQPVSNVENVVRQELDLMKQGKVDGKHVDHVFTEDTFMQVPGINGQFLKIDKLSFELEIQMTEHPAEFNLSRFVKFVLREIHSDTTTTFIAPK